MSTLLLLGASSAISQAYLDLVGKQFSHIFLVARSDSKLEQVVRHVEVSTSATVYSSAVDLADTSQHQRLFELALNSLGNIDQVMICYGDLTDQQRCREDVDYLVAQFTLNATSTISLSAHAVRVLAREGGGDLVVVGSVAGDRGRKSNYAYGAAKGAVATFLAGLGMDVESENVRVLTVKPGFVDTPMTAQFKKGVLWTSPDKVARGIASAIDRQRSVVYVPWYWFCIMMVIKLLPSAVLKKLPI